MGPANDVEMYEMKWSVVDEKQHQKFKAYLTGALPKAIKLIGSFGEKNEHWGFMYKITKSWGGKMGIIFQEAATLN